MDGANNKSDEEEKAEFGLVMKYFIFWRINTLEIFLAKLTYSLSHRSLKSNENTDTLEKPFSFFIDFRFWHCKEH